MMALLFLALSSVAIFAISLAMIWRYRNGILHPAFWTNLGLCGYAVGGGYYAAFGAERALFLNLARIDIDRIAWLSGASGAILLFQAVINVTFLLADARLAPNRRTTEFQLHSRLPQFLPPVVILGRIAALILIALGVAYWAYVAEQLAGGIPQLFVVVGAYPYLVSNKGITTLPYYLAYGGIELWMLLWLSSIRYRWIGLVPLPIGMLMILSSGRISHAMGYGFVVVLTYLALSRKGATWRTFVASFAALAPIAIFFYFFRQYTSYVYIGKADQFPLFAPPPPAIATPEIAPPIGNIAPPIGNIAPPIGNIDQSPAFAPPPVTVAPDNPTVGEDSFTYLPQFLIDIGHRVSYILDTLVGSGNVPDLQQIVLIVKGLLDGRLALEYGATYFDWINNLLGSQIGQADKGIQSVGYRILHAYFPEKVGGPTPGMIGEAIINFGYLAPIAIALICLVATWLFWKMMRWPRALLVLLYVKVLIGFWALFLKVDSSLMGGMVFALIPILICWLGLCILDIAFRKIIRRKIPASVKFARPL